MTMFFLLYGEDNYRARRTLAALRGRFSATRDASGLNQIVLQAGVAEIEQAVEALMTIPFLSEKKMVVLEGFLDESDEDQERLKEVLARLPDTTVAVFVEEESGENLKDKPLFELLSGQQFSSEFPAMSPAQASSFVASEAQTAGVTVARRAADMLVAKLGVESWPLSLETQKLASFVLAEGRKEITDADVRDLSVGTPEESVFAFVDSCVEGRKAEAVSELARLLDSGMSEFQVLAALTRQYRTLIGAEELVRRGVRDKNALASMLGIHPFPAGKAMAAVRRLSSDDLRERFRDLVDIERRCKTGACSSAALLAVFAVKAAGKG